MDGDCTVVGLVDGTATNVRLEINVSHQVPVDGVATQSIGLASIEYLPQRTKNDDSMKKRKALREYNSSSPHTYVGCIYNKSILLMQHATSTYSILPIARFSPGRGAWNIMQPPNSSLPTSSPNLPWKQVWVANSPEIKYYTYIKL